MMFSCGWKERRFSLKTSHSCKGPAVRITKENQPKGNSMIGKKKQNKTGKIYIEAIYIYIYIYITMQKHVLLNI